jgi:hypothetical protein
LANEYSLRKSGGSILTVLTGTIGLSQGLLVPVFRRRHSMSKPIMVLIIPAPTDSFPHKDLAMVERYLDQYLARRDTSSSRFKANFSRVCDMFEKASTHIDYAAMYGVN